MNMVNDELRALADALDRIARTHAMIAPDESEMQHRAADYLRAQADAQPVPAVPAGWKVVPVEPTQAMNNAGLSAVNQYGKRSVWETYAAMLTAAPAVPAIEERGPWTAWEAFRMSTIDYKALAERVAQRAIYADNNADPNNKAWAADLRAIVSLLKGMADAQPVAWIAHNLTTGHVKWTTDRCRAHGWIQGGNLRVKSLYTHPAPAAPQAEPIADSDADYWLRNRQAILDAIERSGFVLMSNASGFWLHPRGATEAQAEPKREPLSDERIIEIQRAAYERAAQECIETAAELRRCADGCTDGRYDWKADGVDDCADAIRALGGEK